MALFVRKKKIGGRVYVEINVSLHKPTDSYTQQ